MNEKDKVEMMRGRSHRSRVERVGHSPAFHGQFRLDVAADLLEDDPVRGKRERPVLSADEQARIDALRRARRTRRKPSTAGVPEPKPWLSKQEAQQARSEARLARSGAGLARMKQEQAQVEQERTLVEARAQAHLSRVRDDPCAPWDDEFVRELHGLLLRGQERRAEAIALAVTTQTISWRLPDATLTERLRSAQSPLVTDLRASTAFMAFIRSRVIPGYQRWVTAERQKQRTRMQESQSGREEDRDAETRREEATTRRRPVSKRY